MDYLKSSDPKDIVISKVVDAACKKNAEFKKSSLSSSELNDIPMQMFRVKAIAVMIEETTRIFVKNINRIMDGSIAPGFEIIKNSNCAQLCTITKKFDYRYGFQHKEVLQLELQGNNYIKSMMSMLWKAISNDECSEKPFERYVLGGISENYRRVYDKSDKSIYAKCQLLCDSMSGMTESHLIKKHDHLKSLENDVS